MMRSSSSGRAIFLATRIPQRNGWCSTAQSACGIPGRRSPGKLPDDACAQRSVQVPYGSKRAARGGKRAMVDQGRSRGRTETWRPWTPADPRPALAWSDGLAGLARNLTESLRRWALADVGPGAPDAVACGRIWLRNHPLFYRRAGASDLG